MHVHVFCECDINRMYYLETMFFILDLLQNKLLLTTTRCEVNHEINHSVSILNIVNHLKMLLTCYISTGIHFNLLWNINVCEFIYSDLIFELVTSSFSVVSHRLYS